MLRSAGETTKLGAPRPSSRSQQGDGGEGSGKGSSSGSGAGGGGDDGQRAYAAHDPRAEAPLEDKTGEYAAAGVFIGAFLGWASQFI